MADPKLDGLFQKAITAAKKSPRKRIGFYAVEAAPDGRTYVYSRDRDAIQAFHGWGGTADQIDADFYGNSNPSIIASAPRTKGSERAWRWHLGPEHAKRMIGLIDRYIDDKNYYSASEKIRAKELRAVLTALR